jgi:hypothetical protein
LIDVRQPPARYRGVARQQANEFPDRLSPRLESCRSGD